MDSLSTMANRCSRSCSVAESALPAQQQILSVSQLTRYLKYLVEQDELLAGLSVQGEICESSRSTSGHYYLTIKDATSQITCVLFRREAAQQPEAVAELRKGAFVVIHGFLTLYEPRGTCQVYIQRILSQGEGIFARQFAELKAKLEREGLFAADRKRPLPEFPRKLALLTSPHGQAYHDVLHRLKAQYPFATVIVAGVSVQGDGAADEIILALDIVNRLTDAEVILIVRGGGAPQDLAAFNNERLARAVFSSRVPVITGVGHETDFTMVDFVADYRAATPSLAAAAAVPDTAALVSRMQQLHGELRYTVGQRLAQDRRRWIEVNRALLRTSPENGVRNQRQRTDDLVRGQQRAVQVLLRAKRAQLARLAGQLDMLDPLAILKRGYAVITRPETGQVISRVTDVVAGESLRAQVSDGNFRVRVEDA